MCPRVIPHGSLVANRCFAQLVFLERGLHGGPRVGLCGEGGGVVLRLLHPQLVQDAQICQTITQYAQLLLALDFKHNLGLMKMGVSSTNDVAASMILSSTMTGKQALQVS